MDPIQIQEVQSILNRKGIELVISPDHLKLRRFFTARYGWVFSKNRAYIPGSMNHILADYDNTNLWCQVKTAVLFTSKHRNGLCEVHLDLYTLYNREL